MYEWWYEIMIFIRVKIGLLLRIWHGQMLNQLCYIFLTECYVALKCLWRLYNNLGKCLNISRNIRYGILHIKKTGREYFKISIVVAQQVNFFFVCFPVVSKFCYL